MRHDGHVIQSCSTSAITCVLITTVAPAARKPARMARTTAADTGSTASNGSSSTSTLRPCNSALARPIFFRMPVE